MADNKHCCTPDISCIKEAICIDTERVYDSCADKDCLRDLRVYFPDGCDKVIENATSVRCRGCEIINCRIDVETVPFNKGFYCVTSTFYVKVTVEITCNPTSPPIIAHGLSTFEKKCVLYGSDGHIKVFSSEFCPDGDDVQLPPAGTNPKAKIQCAEPICLAADICRICDCCNTLGDTNISVPPAVSRCFDGCFGCCHGDKAVRVTIGVFTIIQLERDVQMLIPAYDFCVPTKECCCETEDPCDAFRRIKFPVDEFFPPNCDAR